MTVCLRHLKFIMTRFRLGISDIAVHHCRYKRLTDKDLIFVHYVEQHKKLNYILFYVDLC